MKNVKERGQLFGWQSILNEPKGDSTKNLIDKYCLVELEDIKAHALIYENEAGRNAQNASQMYTFLSASLTDEAKAMVLCDFADYTIVMDDGTAQVTNGP